MTKKVISVIIALLLISVSIMSFAANSQDQLQSEMQNIQNSIKEANTKIDGIKDKVDDAMKEIETLNAEISQKEDEIYTLNTELNSLNEEISVLTGKLEEEQKKYDTQYDTLCKRLVAQYKAGSVSYLDVLLNSKSLSNFISNYFLIGKIAEYDTDLLEKIKEQKTSLEKSKAELDEKQDQLEEKQAALNVEEIHLKNTKANKNKYVSQLSEEEKELQKEIDELNEQYKQKEREFQEIARKNANNSGGYVYTGGELKWPCPGYTRISSTFGYRGSAATGGVGSSNHKGIDMAAPHGTAILAAESGSVITVSNNCTHDYAKTAKTRCSCGGGYGNYIMISHGNGLVTLYGHCSSISVRVGQTVTKGQQIGTVGTTGYSTGNHLHFSVLLNGTYVNPAPYLGM